MRNKKIIIGSILVICAIVVGSTLAWFTWSTTNEQNTNVVVTVGGTTISYEDGEDITNNNLIPTSTKEQGISKDITISSTGQVYLDLNMTVVALDDGLREVSFKYGLYDSYDTPVVEGSFVGSNTNDVINLLSEVEITSIPVTYTLYIWIDGTMSNPNTMYNQNFEFRLNANATDEKSASKQTLDKLGLTSNGMKSVVTNVATTDEGIYQTRDDYGTTYYFRGAVENNYVKFADYYWRIVRINGNGSIRLIYDGTVAHANGESSDDRQIGTSAYNENYGDNAYVGYMYGQAGASTYAETHANINDSTVKTVVDNWYKTNIVDKGYSNKIEEDAIYCNDRSVSVYIPNSYNNLGYATNVTAYRWYNGPWSVDDYNQQVTMKCSQINQDGMSTSSASKGNKALTYPVGLLTNDEAGYSGGYNTNNSSYYLYTGQIYWTMSPRNFGGNSAGVRLVDSAGTIGGNNRVNNNGGVRPVLSLKSDVQISGSGTMEDPYVLS